jgi:hypothetical protein
MGQEKAPGFSTVAIVTVAASVVSVAAARLRNPNWFFTWSPMLATLSWALYSFVRFGKRGWWILLIALTPIAASLYVLNEMLDAFRAIVAPMHPE